MANGELVSTETAKWSGHHVEVYKMLDAETSVVNGVWIPCAGADAITVLFETLTLDTCQVRCIAPKAIGKPLDTVTGLLFGSNVTGEDIIGIPHEKVPLYFKVAKTVSVAGEMTDAIALVKYRQGHYPR